MCGLSKFLPRREPRHPTSATHYLLSGNAVGGDNSTQWFNSDLQNSPSFLGSGVVLSPLTFLWKPEHFDDDWGNNHHRYKAHRTLKHVLADASRKLQIFNRAELHIKLEIAHAVVAQSISWPFSHLKTIIKYFQIIRPPCVAVQQSLF